MTAQPNLDVLNSLLSSFAGHAVVAKPRPALVPFRNFLAEALGDTWTRLETELLGGGVVATDARLTSSPDVTTDILPQTGTKGLAAGGTRLVCPAPGMSGESGQTLVATGETHPGLSDSATADRHPGPAVGTSTRRVDARPVRNSLTGRTGVRTEGMLATAGVSSAEAAQALEFAVVSGETTVSLGKGDPQTARSGAVVAAAEVTDLGETDPQAVGAKILRPVGSETISPEGTVWIAANEDWRHPAKQASVVNTATGRGPADLPLGEESFAGLELGDPRRAMFPPRDLFGVLAGEETSTNGAVGTSASAGTGTLNNEPVLRPSVTQSENPLAHEEVLPGAQVEEGVVPGTRTAFAFGFEKTHVSKVTSSSDHGREEFSGRREALRPAVATDPKPVEKGQTRAERASENGGVRTLWLGGQKHRETRAYAGTTVPETPADQPSSGPEQLAEPDISGRHVSFPQTGSSASQAEAASTISTQPTAVSASPEPDLSAVAGPGGKTRPLGEGVMHLADEPPVLPISRPWAERVELDGRGVKDTSTTATAKPGDPSAKGRETSRNAARSGLSGALAFVDQAPAGVFQTAETTGAAEGPESPEPGKASKGSLRVAVSTTEEAPGGANQATKTAFVSETEPLQAVGEGNKSDRGTEIHRRVAPLAAKLARLLEETGARVVHARAATEPQPVVAEDTLQTGRIRPRMERNADSVQVESSKAVLLSSVDQESGEPSRPTFTSRGTGATVSTGFVHVTHDGTQRTEQILRHGPSLSEQSSAVGRTVAAGDARPEREALGGRVGATEQLPTSNTHGEAGSVSSRRQPEHRARETVGAVKLQPADGRLQRTAESVAGDLSRGNEEGAGTTMPASGTETEPIAPGRSKQKVSAIRPTAARPRKSSPQVSSPHRGTGAAQVEEKGRHGHEQVKFGPAGTTAPQGSHAAPVGEAHTEMGHVRRAGRLPSTPPAVQAEQILDQVRSRLVRHRLLPNRNSLVVQLRPPELGRIRIRVEAQGQVLRAVVEADSSATRDLLHSSVQHLVQTLDEQGLRVQQIQILPFADRQANPDQSQHGPGRQATPDWTDQEAGENAGQRSGREDRWAGQDGGWVA